MSDYNHNISFDACYALMLVGKYVRFKGMSIETVTAYLDSKPETKYRQTRKYIHAGWHIRDDNVLLQIQKLNEKSHDMTMKIIDEMMIFAQENKA